MSNSGELLRMLMPAVSPVPTRDVSRPGILPIEARSFESLLEDAHRAEIQVDTTDRIQGAAFPEGAEEITRTESRGVLSSLSGIESIQNASLRRIVGEARGQ